VSLYLDYKKIPARIALRIFDCVVMEACLAAHARRTQTESQAERVRDVSLSKSMWDAPSLVKAPLVATKKGISGYPDESSVSIEGSHTPARFVHGVDGALEYMHDTLVKVYVPLPMKRLNVQEWKCVSCECVFLCNGPSTRDWSCRMCAEGIFQMEDFPEPPTQQVICGWCARTSRFAIEDMVRSHGYVCVGCEENANFVVMCTQQRKR